MSKGDESFPSAQREKHQLANTVSIASILFTDNGDNSRRQFNGNALKKYNITTFTCYVADESENRKFNCSRTRLSWEVFEFSTNGMFFLSNTSSLSFICASRLNENSQSDEFLSRHRRNFSKSHRFQFKFFLAIFLFVSSTKATSVT